MTVRREAVKRVAQDLIDRGDLWRGSRLPQQTVIKET